MSRALPLHALNLLNHLIKDIRQFVVQRLYLPNSQYTDDDVAEALPIGSGSLIKLDQILKLTNR